MLTKQELAKLHTNQRLLVKELQSRGIDVAMLSAEMELLEAKYKEHKEFLLDRDSSINPYPASVIAGDKYLTKKLLQREGISVCKGEQFFGDQIKDALVYAQNIGFPLVAKPSFGSHGHNVHMDLETLCHVKTAIETILAENRNAAFIVEEQFEGSEHRVFITREGNYAVLHRDPAHVIGNGRKTIEQLANDESNRRMNPRTTCLCPILLDDSSLRYLSRSGKTLAYVPESGEKVYLRHNSNVAAGATCEDYTDKVHPSVIEISKKALSAFHGMPYAGIDFMSRDITAEQAPGMYKIIEVNSIPGIHMHMCPGSGKPRDVAKYIADMIFPETKRI